MFNYKDRYINRNIGSIFSVYRSGCRVEIKYKSPDLEDDIITFDNEEEAIDMYNVLLNALKMR